MSLFMIVYRKMADQEILLKKESREFMRELLKLQNKIKDSLMKFISSKLEKCLVMECSDTRAKLSHIMDVFDGENHALLPGPIHLVSSDKFPMKIISTMPKLVIIEVVDDKQINAHLSSVMRIINCLKLSLARKLIFVTSALNSLDKFLKTMKEGTYSIINKDSSMITRKLAVFENSPLLEAAAHGRLEIISELCKLDVDINKHDPDSGDTALHVAAQAGHVNVVLFLIEKDALVTPNASGLTPLEAAAQLGHEDVAIALLENSSNTHPDDSDVLVRAAGDGFQSLVLVLLNYGADVNIRDEKDRSALHLAAARGHYSIVYFLLQYKANVNSQDKYLHTPLHYAVLNGFFDVMKLLLDYDAWIDAVTIEGRSPLDLARKFGRSEMAEFLEDRLEEGEVLKQAIRIIKRRSLKT